jgi:putative ATPase
MSDQDSLFGDPFSPGAAPPPVARASRAEPASGPAPAIAGGVPLAERLRPATIDEVIGQQHLLGPGQPLRAAFAAGRLHSMILWGPPGVGKTTLAKLMAGAVDADFIVLSAVLAGVKDIREAVVRAEIARARGRRTIVFVDEVHRFNKAQQDAFLPHVESGLFTFIGATTENPSFEVNSALLSRASVHVLRALEPADLGLLLDRATGLPGAPALTEGARTRLVAYADGDARRLLNAYEALMDRAEDSAAERASAGLVPGEGRGAAPEPVDEARLEQALGEQMRRYDKGGDQFYDTISALHKAVRGSDPDASLYWFARMIDGGADPRYMARRLIRMASEDVGNADPRALRIALDAAEVYERLGTPEGELALAQAVVYLAVAPKSNAVYKAWGAVRDDIRREGTRPVPMHLRNAPTSLMKQLGMSKGYRYAHDEPGGFAAGVEYWPDDKAPQRYYRPVPRGLELRIGEKLAELQRLNAQALRGEGGPHPASPPDTALDDDAPG